jgi:hypothetical protein
VEAGAEGVEVAAASGGAGCEGWVGFMLMGLLSSGRAFHMLAPFSLVLLFFRPIQIQTNFKLTYDLERLSQINQDLPASLLLPAKMK